MRRPDECCGVINGEHDPRCIEAPAREWTLKVDDEFQFLDGVRAYGLIIASGSEIEDGKRVAVIEKTALNTAAPEMYEALKDMFKLMDEGRLVRDISKDNDPKWTLVALDLVARLKTAHAALSKAEGGK